MLESLETVLAGHDDLIPWDHSNHAMWHWRWFHIALFLLYEMLDEPGLQGGLLLEGLRGGLELETGFVGLVNFPVALFMFFHFNNFMSSS